MYMRIISIVDEISNLLIMNKKCDKLLENHYYSHFIKNYIISSKQFDELN